MSIPAGWTIEVAPDSLGVRVFAVNNYGETVPHPLLVLSHDQARQLSAGLLNSFREARDAKARKLPAPQLAKVPA
jgi:hypothetical protein